MRQAHVAGEKLFVDYAGTTIDILNATTGEVHACHCSSQPSVRRATPTPRRRPRSRCPTGSDRTHARSHFFGGVPAMVVPTI